MSSTTNTSVVLGVFQANLGRSRLATKELPNLISNGTPDVYLIQEHYSYKGEMKGLPLSWKVLVADGGKVLVAIRNKNINVIARHIGKEIVVADLLCGTTTLTVISFYIPPSQNKIQAISHLEEVIENLNITSFILGGDINMRSLLWGPDIPDHRASDDGGPFVDFILKHGLNIINDPNSASTFETKNGQSWIDITVSTSLLSDKIRDWKVTKEVFSDHSSLTYKIAFDTLDLIGNTPNFSQRKIFRLGNMVAAKFSEAETEIKNIHSKKGLEDWINKLTCFIQSACRGTNLQKADHLRVPWWDTELDIQRKKTRALRSRYQRCKDPSQRLCRRTIFKKEEAKYKWMIKVKSRECFEKLCLSLTNSNPFDLPYKLATGKTKKKMVFNTVINDQGIKTKSIDETITTIVNKLFPQDLFNSETPEQAQTRVLVESY
ncbi:hypothetical protein AVEN_77449-1 [Araneus ventricosus]|uniref:Endonuclease/exonuclease/phosphatase domain-containing protein n=1 Tax=Araneus ventricosus TaxID=182803 RepID=A0A4Y2W3Y0_ARAVE|nr:hypothetical protein AVEN_77449-1 [Araneus ventricosus]